MHPGEHIMPTVVLMDPARRTPLSKTVCTHNVDVGKVPVAHGSGIESVGVYPAEARFI